MNIFSTAYCRVYQSTLYVLMPLLRIREPIMQVDDNVSMKAYEILNRHGLKKAFVITDKNIVKLGLANKILAGLKNSGIEYCLFDDVRSNPTVQNVEDALKVFLTKYDRPLDVALIAIGGGSSIDTMKALYARLANPNKSLNKMAGILRVGGKKAPLMIAIPTTAGTGSEATLAAVIVDEASHHKYAINDPHLVPQYALLDPTLLVDLPPFITAITGMDALTHVVESYIGHGNTKKTKKYALMAMEKIATNLLKCYREPDNLHARKEMLLASYYAGLAFTRAYVGYSHAISHAFGGLYNVPHGLANAIILPVLLEEYGPRVNKKLAVLADVAKVGLKADTPEHKAQAFIKFIRDLNKEMEIPEKLDIHYNFHMVAKMATLASKEANPLYPVPVTMDIAQLVSIISKTIK